MSAVPVAYMRLCVAYDPKTGIFTGIERPREHFPTERDWLDWRRLKIGMPFGENVREGGRVILPIIDEGFCYGILASRVAFAFTNGRWPLDGMVVDHKNRDPRDDRIRNLREVTDSVNANNRGRNPFPPGTPARLSSAQRKAAFAAVRAKEIGRLRAEVMQLRAEAKARLHPFQQPWNRDQAEPAP
jgi:hypothetical protein